MGYDDYIEFALDVAEQSDILLAFPDKVGAQARFGHYHGRWTLVTSGNQDYGAQSIARHAIHDALANDLDEVELRDPSNDRAWVWFTKKPKDGEFAMVESHCMCGAFKCSTCGNRVQHWRRSHNKSCEESKPSILYPDND
jgi:hypothetical protein